MNKHKIGIIGLGAYGEFCIKAFQEMPEVEIFGIAEKNIERGKELGEKYNINFVTDDYTNLLKQDVSAVVILTPPFLHTGMAIAAAKAGKSFLIEKPMALTVEDAEKIIEEVNKNNVKATIGYVMRYSPLYGKVKDIVKSNKFGKLKRLYFENYANEENLPKNHWLWEEKKSGGLLVEHGVHFFDIFSYIKGEKYKSAKSFTPEVNNNLAIVQYPDESIATFYHSFDKPALLERNFAKFVFENGYAEIEGWIPLNLKTEWVENGEVKIKKESIESDKSIHYSALVQEVLRDLFKQIEDASYTPKVTLQDARDSLELAITARENKIFKKFII